MNKPVVKRFLAYTLDLLIVLIVTSAIASLPVFKKQYKEYSEFTDQYIESIREIQTDPEKVNDLLNDESIMNNSYEVMKKGLFINVIGLVLTVVYFVGFQYYTGGKTGGKALFKIEVVPTDTKELKFKHILIRSLVVNSIVMTTISIVLLACTSKNVYMNINQYTEIINIGILMLCAGMVLYNANGEGLHDKLAHTRVINSDEKEYYMKKVLNKENKKVEEK